MNNTNENAYKGGILKIITGILVPIFCVLLTYFLTDTSTQATIVERLSVYFDVVDKNMSYEQAIQALREDSKELVNANLQLKAQNIDLQNKVSDTPNIEFKNPDIIADGLKVQESANKAVLVIDNKNYYSEDMVNQMLKYKFIYSSEQNTLFYNTKQEIITSETKIDLFDTGVLYDGTCYEKFLPSDGKSFPMGSDTYNKGFVIYDDHSLFGDGDGYALFDLKGGYSKISFDVGRTNEYEKQNVVLKVYLDNEYVEEYSLNAQSPPVHLEINLNYANNMKLEITGGSRVKYGFANAILYY